MRRTRAKVWVLLLTSGAIAAPPQAVGAQATSRASMPQLHHVGLNSVDPDRAIEWYLRVWPAAKRTQVAGQPAVEADIFLLFHKVDRPPAGAWRDDRHRSEPQSAFWHIGAFTNTTDLAARLRAVGITHLPLYTSPQDTVGVWRSGLAPYVASLTAKQLQTAPAAPPRDGGFSYVVAPDGVLFELTGGPAHTTLSRTCTSSTSGRCAPRTGTWSTSGWSCRPSVTAVELNRRAGRGIRAT
jgi:catechol 2,3-dioxygenase-like lactoylglutathione lyase family enzyme